MNDLQIENILINSIANGNTVRVSLIDNEADDQRDRWTSEEFYFESLGEVLAFLETNWANEMPSLPEDIAAGIRQ